MISKESIERDASEVEPFPHVSDKDIVVYLLGKLCNIKDENTLKEAYKAALKCARTLSMNFDALQNNNGRRVGRATIAETIYPILKVLLATYSIRKKVIVTTGFLAELADEKHIKL